MNEKLNFYLVLLNVMLHTEHSCLSSKEKEKEKTDNILCSEGVTVFHPKPSPIKQSQAGTCMGKSYMICL